ncbi:MAG: methionyl-tRNA formyltransferase [Patescibacteria group bacterium]
MNNTPRIAFFGTSDFSVRVLEVLKQNAFLPMLIVTVPDKPVGRKHILTAPPIKIWAEENKIDFLQPAKLKDPDFFYKLKAKSYDLFVVAAYGKIIPLSVIEFPKHGTLNVHPSLLPQFRGATPIESAILLAEETGVTIMRVDAEMDHGPIISQEKLDIAWPQDAEIASKMLAEIGGKMLTQIIPALIRNEIHEIPQDESKATYTKKIETKDGELNLNDSPTKTWKKYLAYRHSVGVYFLTKRNQKDMRVIVTKAQFENGQFVIQRVKPEGKKEMGYEDFKRGEKVVF